MSKEKVIEYIMNSPYNTNRQVLEGLLDSIGGEEYTVLLEETVTTTQAEGESLAVGNLAFARLVDADNIKVTFDGVEYECTAQISHEVETEYLYGGISNEGEIDFSEYPFVIYFGLSFNGGVNNQLLTETPGAYSIKIEVPKDDGDSQSDWSTAEVTFINTGEGVYNVRCLNVTPDGLEDVTLTVNGHEQTSMIVPLYKNRYLFNSFFNFINPNSQPTVTGNIRIGDSAADGFEITGDGTISQEGIGIIN